MFCKNCGKEISNDSNFCQYCGSKLSDGCFPSLLIRKIFSSIYQFKLSDKNKNILICYSMWLIINFIFLLIESSNKNASHWFFPFESIELGDYDNTEFVFYSFLFPYLLLCAYIIYQRKKKNK